MSRRQYLEQACTRLVDSASARLDVELLLMHACEIGRAELMAHPDTVLEPAQEQRLDNLLSRRAAGEPIAYLVGQREFWSLKLDVTPATLIPRPETELLVEKALARIPTDAAWTVADLGTGCGAIALALASERPRLKLIATDRSTDALAVARANAARHRLNNIEFRAGDWLGALDETALDIIVSNPPYVRADDPCLLRGDTRFEPAVALAGGPDGLDAIRRIAYGAKRKIKPGGWLLLEHGNDQGGGVRALLRQYGYSDIMCYRDLSGHDRVSEGRLLV